MVVSTVFSPKLYNFEDLNALLDDAMKICWQCIVFVIHFGGWSSRSLVSGQLDEHAVPTVLVSGVAKGGTTYLYALLRTFDDFHSKDRKSRHSVLEKEFNVPYRSQRYLNAPEYLQPCPAETITRLMRCPAHVARKWNPHLSPPQYVDSVKECTQWLEQALTKSSGIASKLNFIRSFEIPLYVVDANPLFNIEAEHAMPILMTVNRANSMCVLSTTEARRPFVMTLLRHPLGRLESYYTHFIVRRYARVRLRGAEDENDEEDEDGYVVLAARRESHAPRGNSKRRGGIKSKGGAISSLDEMIGRELLCLEPGGEAHTARIDLEQTAALWVEVVHAQVGRPYQYSATYEAARAIIGSYERVKSTLQTCAGSRMVLDGVYVPQVLSLLYPKVKTRREGGQYGLQSSEGHHWPVLIIESEYMFSQKPAAFRRALYPYLYPSSSAPRFEEDEGGNRIVLLNKFKAMGLDSRAEAGIRRYGDQMLLFDNGTKSATEMAKMSASIVSRVQTVYQPLNEALYKTVEWLQTTKRIAVLGNFTSKFDKLQTTTSG